jgi:polar amino acid transport system substrate-binding protein
MKKLIIYILIVLSLLFTYGCNTGPANEVHSPEDVRDRTIGALAGSASAQLASDLGNVVTFFDIEEMVNHLRVGTLDCIVIEQVVAEEIVADARGIRILDEPLLEYDLRFAVARENVQLLNAVNEAIEELNFNGTLGRLRGKYFAGRSFTLPTSEPMRPGYISLAVSLDSVPFSFIDIYGEYTGFDIEVARAVSDFLGVELRIVRQEVSELIQSVWLGRADLAVGWLPDDVGDYVNVSESYADSAHVVIVRR